MAVMMLTMSVEVVLPLDLRRQRREELPQFLSIVSRGVWGGGRFIVELRGTS